MHVLTNLVPDRAVADCAACGPATAVRYKNGGSGRRRWQCRTAVRATKGARPTKGPRPQPVFGRGVGRTRAERHGITEDRLHAMLRTQGGVCAICATAPAAGMLFIDHDHGCCPGVYSCGRCVRGLLCPRCNSALGYLEDDRDRLRAALAYLGD